MAKKQKVGEQGKKLKEQSEDPKAKGQAFQKEKMKAEIFKEII